MTERIGAAIREAAETVQAPEHLRRRPAPRRRALRPVAAVAATAAAAGVLLLTGGSGPTVPEVAAAALDRPQRPATARERDRFASWGWRAVGTRTDEVDGRRAHTVIYRRGERGVHYTVVEGRSLPAPAGAERAGRYAVSRAQGATVVSWRRADGRTCVLASRALGERELLEFASW